MRSLIPSRFTSHLSLLRVLHWGMARVLLRAGYQWEVRRKGELMLGLWRKSWSKGKAGAPRRLVVVPGFGDTPASWLPALTLLRGTLRHHFDEIVLLDFPGYGGFLSHERPFHSMDLLISAVEDVFDSLKPQTILGHSLGAWLTAIYASDCGIGKRPLIPGGARVYSGPERIILIDSPGVFEDTASRDRWEQTFQRVLEEGLKAWRPHIFAKEPFWFPLVASHVARFFAREEVRQFIQSVRDDHLLEPLLAGLAQPEVWLVWSEKDTLIPASAATTWLRALPAHNPRVRGAILNRVGHSPQIENPLCIAALLRHWWAGRPLSAQERWWKELQREG